jgi:hypothetical protein
MTNDTVLTLERNSSGQLFIGADELDECGYGVRSYVIVGACEGLAESVVRRRFEDLVVLTAGNVVDVLDLSDDWRRVGVAAFEAGLDRVVPRHALVDHGAQAARDWYAGWDAANLSAPVPDVL